MTTSALRVLIAGGSPEERGALRQLLASAGADAFSIDEATADDCGAAARREPPPSCALLTACPPDQGGQQALTSLLAVPDLPVVLLTSADNEEYAAQAVERGAHDYLVSDTLTPRRLALTVRRAVEAFRFRGLAAQSVRLLTSARRQAVALQQQHEQRLLLALDAARLATWDWDLASGQISFTASATIHFDLQMEHLVRTIDEWAELIYPPDRPRYDQAVTEAMTADHVYKLQLRVYANDGRLIWIEVHAFVQRDGAGRPERLLGVVHDISDEKRRELSQALHAAINQVLTQSSDLAATLQTIASLPLPDLADYCAIHLLGDDGVAVPVAAIHTGSEKQALLARLQYPFDCASDQTLLGEALRTGASRLIAEVPEELLAVTPSGAPPEATGLVAQLAPHSALIVPLEADGRIHGVMRLGLTEGRRRYDEADLRLAESVARRCASAIMNAQLNEAALLAQRRQAETLAQLSTLIAHAPIGISFLDTELRYCQINPVLAALNTHRVEDHIGRHIREVIPLIAPQVEAICRQVMATGEPVINREHSGTFSSMPGVERTWLSSFYPVRGPDGAILGVGTLAHEITERKQAEAALREHAEALSRTNAMLARALRLKDEFLAMMSHELRTPLNVVLGITEALDEGLYGPLSERQHTALNTVAQSGRHLLAILADILDLARIEAGAEPLELQIVDVEILCQSAVQFVQATARQKGLRLRYSIEAGITGLRGDERRLTQILVNLLDNAVKFTPAGGTVGLQVTTDTAREIIQLTVSDTGIGIGAEDIDRLFQPFTQVDAGLSRQYGGIGLGLTLVRRLVDLHGGSISLESAPGQGSRFTVCLSWPADDNAAPAPLSPETDSPTWGRPPSVLLADDHEATLALYSDWLTGHGCQVTTARSGDEAVARVREVRPDVAVLDLQMPGTDGLAAIRLIREGQAAATLPIIALTALAMPGDRERCLAAGASAYLAKPTSLRTLLETIAAVLRG